QAEDGIRYFHVTGVQTCALPILTSNKRKAPPIQTIPICLKLTRPIKSNNTLVPNSIKAVDRLAHAISTKTKHTVPIMGINDFFKSLISCALRDSMRAKNVMRANLAKSDVWKVWLITGMVTQRLASFTLLPPINVKSN